jgi:hypothetical protein
MQHTWSAQQSLTLHKSPASLHHELECTTNGSYTEAHFYCALLHSTHTEVTLGTKSNMKMEVLQDRLPPVSGVMCNSARIDKLGWKLANLGSQHSRSSHPGASGILQRHNRNQLAAVLDGRPC